MTCTLSTTVSTERRAGQHARFARRTRDRGCSLCSGAGGSRRPVGIQERVDPVGGPLTEIPEEECRVSLHQAERADFLHLRLRLRLAAWGKE